MAEKYLFMTRSIKNLREVMERDNVGAFVEDRTLLEKISARVGLKMPQFPEDREAFLLQEMKRMKEEEKEAEIVSPKP